MMRFLPNCIILVLLLSGCTDKEDKQQALYADFSSFQSPSLETLPDADAQSIKIYPRQAEVDGSFAVYETWPNRLVEIYHRSSDGQLVRLETSPEWRRFARPILVEESNGRLFVAVYDVDRNLPGGREPGRYIDGIDLYEISSSTDYRPKRLGDGLQVGGIEDILYGRAYGDEYVICGKDSCYTVSRSGEATKWDRSGIADYEFVEVLIDRSDHAYALLRPKHDERIHGPIGDQKVAATYSRFLLGDMTPSGASVSSISQSVGIPYYLKIERGKVVYDLARSVEQYRDLFRFELARMPHSGLMEFGANNLEGRVAWAQNYYLNGLVMVSASNGHLSTFVDEALRNEVSDRVRRELDLLARLTESTYPAYLVKRYSVDREPLIFSLHLARIARTLGLAKLSGLKSPQIDRAQGVLEHELITLENTVETIGVAQENGKSYPTLRYKSGMPFWADGVTVPYNYTTGYIHGLLSSSERPSKESIDRAESLSKAILEIERPSEKTLWRYWWADGFNGWKAQSGISVQTPSWHGHKTGTITAHVTYRSIDALGLIALYRNRKSAVPEQVIDSFERMVSEGWLLPFVNEELSIIGRPATLYPSVAYRYARSATSCEIESQIWALRDLSTRVSAGVSP